MRYSILSAIAALGYAGYRFLTRRAALPHDEEAHSPEQILLQKQVGLHAAAIGDPVVEVAPVKSAVVEASGELRQALVARTAYFLARQRGFVPGREAEDWAVAEAMVAGGSAAKA